MLRIKNPQDALVAILFIAIGGAGLWLGRNLTLGSATAMGPGYLPRLLSFGVIAIGVIVGLQAFSPGQPLKYFVWRPLVLVTASITFFGLAIDRLGLVIAVAGAVVIGSFASKEAKPWEVAVIAAGIALFSVAVFVWGLRQSMSVWPV